MIQRYQRNQQDPFDENQSMEDGLNLLERSIFSVKEDLLARGKKTCHIDIIQGAHVTHYDMETVTNTTLLVLRKQISSKENLKELGTYKESIRVYNWSNLD